MAGLLGGRGAPSAAEGGVEADAVLHDPGFGNGEAVLDGDEFPFGVEHGEEVFFAGVVEVSCEVDGAQAAGFRLPQAVADVAFAEVPGEGGFDFGEGLEDVAFVEGEGFFDFGFTDVLPGAEGAALPDGPVEADADAVAVAVAVGEVGGGFAAASDFAEEGEAGKAVGAGGVGVGGGGFEAFGRRAEVGALAQEVGGEWGEPGGGEGGVGVGGFDFL